MEYFLPLSVLAMLLSSISIYLIEYKNPTSSTKAENDQTPSNPSDSLEDSVAEFSHSDTVETEQTNDDITTSASHGQREGDSLKFGSSNTNLKMVYAAF